MSNAFATCFRLMLATSPVALAACAPAPLYTSSSPHKGAVTGGEIPRDARGEPVWGAIRPAPADSSPAHAAPPDLQEGDTQAPPMPPGT
ncbi:MAG: hypothetical protein KGZ61_00455 [Sandarakinorhabdus sp.]|nr:hypothetical protein [Sandarakinorhabdus sp.]